MLRGNADADALSEVRFTSRARDAPDLFLRYVRFRRRRDAELTFSLFTRRSVAQKSLCATKRAGLSEHRLSVDHTTRDDDAPTTKKGGVPRSLPRDIDRRHRLAAS